MDWQPAQVCRFSGGAADMVPGFIPGLVVAVGIVHLSARVTRFSRIFDVLTSAVVGFLSATVAARLPTTRTCFYALSIGGVVSLLPGYATLVSILEIASGSVAIGTLQLTTTLVYSLLIGFGLAIGTRTHQLLFPSLALVSSNSVCKDAIPWLYDIALIPAFTAANLVILKGHPSKYPIMLALAALSPAVHSICLAHFMAYPHLATVIAALAVAVAANGYARLTSTVGFADMIVGLLFLVPGSVGVSSSLDTFSQVFFSTNAMTEISVIVNAGQQGIIFSSHMMVIAVSVLVGLVLAAVLLYPIRKLLDGRRKTEYKVKDWLGKIIF